MDENESITTAISPDHPLLNEVTPETGRILYRCCNDKVVKPLLLHHTIPYLEDQTPILL